MSSKFSVHIGDWSGDGHGEKETFYVTADCSLEQVREAYFIAKNGMPKHLCPENFMEDYEDHTIPEKTYRDALKHGYDMLQGFDKETVEEKLQECLEYPQWEPRDMLNYLLWFIKQGDARIEFEVGEIDTFAWYGNDKKKRHIGFMGYGLFGG